MILSTLIVISLIQSPNGSTHMIDKNWTGQLFAYSKNMYTAVAISDDTTPTMRKTLSYFYLGFERQYCSIFRSFNLNEWKVDP